MLYVSFTVHVTAEINYNYFLHSTFLLSGLYSAVLYYVLHFATAATQPRVCYKLPFFFSTIIFIFTTMPRIDFHTLAEPPPE